MHERHCKDNQERIEYPKIAINEPCIVYCRFCGKQCKNKNSLIHHERLCKKNPDRVLTYYEQTGISTLSNRGWNRGLTKETDERVRRNAETLRAGYQEGRIVSHQKGKARTDAEKQKISESMRNNLSAGGRRLGSGRGKKGWYKGYFCDSTYELVYVIYNLDNNIMFSHCRRTYKYVDLDGKEHKYYPDFELPDGSLVEIKGYHTATVDLKLASVTDRPIKILYEKDLAYAFDWVKQHYTYNELSDLYE
jgi:hypothetical protein